MEWLDIEVHSKVEEPEDVHTEPCIGFLPELHLQFVVDQRWYPVLILIDVILSQDKAVGKLEIVC